MDCELDVVSRLKQQAIDAGKIFKVTSKHEVNLPDEQCGFKRTIEQKKPVNCILETDSRAVVSLALLRKQSILLGTYANKLPIMTMNVSRYLYTVEAFSYRNANKNATAQAVDFLISTDIKFRMKCSPNLEFSNFLHRLRSSGYTDYIFELARTLKLNVDLVFNSTLVVRYLNINAESSTKSRAVGFLTAIHDVDRWYVKTTRNPIVTDDAFSYK